MRSAIALVLTLPLWAQDPRLDHARTVNLERAKNLPDFIVDEIAVRYKSHPVNPPQWQKVDTIESEIAVKGDGFKREHTLVNGKAWTRPNLPDGVGWSVRFGYELSALFDPKCHNDIQYSGTEERHAQPALVYQFKTSPDRCFGGFTSKNGPLSRLKATNAPRFGRFTIDGPAGNVIYFEQEASEFPRGFPVAHFKEIDTSDYVKIGESTYLLPVRTEFYNELAREDSWHIVVEYKNHRHFESSTSVTFK